jgi:hypothetical protein
MEAHNHSKLEVLSPYLCTEWYKKKTQPRNKFRIPDLRMSKQDSPLDHDIQWNSVSTEGASLLPVAVDEDGPAGPNAYSRQSRRRQLFDSGPTWYYKYPLDTGRLWTSPCQALGGTNCLVRSKRVSFWASDHLTRLQPGKVERTWVGSWYGQSQGLPQARAEPYDDHF